MTLFIGPGEFLVLPGEVKIPYGFWFEQSVDEQWQKVRKATREELILARFVEASEITAEQIVEALGPDHILNDVVIYNGLLPGTFTEGVCKF